MNKIIYHAKLIYFKLTAWRYCSNFKMKVFYNELLFLVHTLTGFRNMKFYSRDLVCLRTKFGKFYIRDIEIDWLMASPAFERQDIDEVLKQVRFITLNNKKSRVYFIDIGASIGKYTIEIDRNFKNIKIFSFEPDPVAYQLLKKNIKANHLKSVRPFNYAISSKSKNTDFYFYEPMKMVVSFKTNKKVKIKSKTLDDVLLNSLKKNDILFIKLDIEGHEIEALKGMSGIIKKIKYIYMLVEDSGLESSLLKANFVFDRRITPYNSFWHKS